MNPESSSGQSDIITTKAVMPLTQPDSQGNYLNKGLKMDPKRTKKQLFSKVWNHFTKVDKTASCHYCQRVVSLRTGSTGNLKRHLRLRHPSVKLDTEGRGGQLFSQSISALNESDEAVKVLIENEREEEYDDNSPQKDESLDDVITFKRSEYQHTPKRKNKYIEDQRLNKALQLLTASTSELSDECQHFGNFVAAKLRTYETSVRNAVESDIMDAFIKANRGFYNGRSKFHETETLSSSNTSNRPNVHYLIATNVEQSTSTPIIPSKSFSIQDICVSK